MFHSAPVSSACHIRARRRCAQGDSCSGALTAHQLGAATSAALEQQQRFGGGSVHCGPTYAAAASINGFADAQPALDDAGFSGGVNGVDSQAAPYDHLHAARGRAAFATGQTSFGAGQNSFGTGQTSFGGAQASFGAGQTSFDAGQTSFGGSQAGPFATGLSGGAGVPGSGQSAFSAHGSFGVQTGFGSLTGAGTHASFGSQPRFGGQAGFGNQSAFASLGAAPGQSDFGGPPSAVLPSQAGGLAISRGSGQQPASSLAGKSCTGMSAVLLGVGGDGTPNLVQFPALEVQAPR